MRLTRVSSFAGAGSSRQMAASRIVARRSASSRQPLRLLAAAPASAAPATDLAAKYGVFRLSYDVKNVRPMAGLLFFMRFGRRGRCAPALQLFCMPFRCVRVCGSARFRATPSAPAGVEFAAWKAFPA